MPARIARFEVREYLGGGAFGRVYRAYDPRLEREVAIKVPKPGTLDTPKRVERFLGDAKSAAQLRHPNIVPVFDCGKDGDVIYIASAFVRGQTLGDAIEPGPMGFREAATIAMKLAEALAYAHANNIIHRDIKPDNIVVDLAGEPHIIDFGLAHRGGEAERGRSFFGTPSYMSPEQASGDSGDAKPAFDQYALGITLYEMLTGKTPFSGPSKIQMFHHVNTTPPPLREMNPNIPLDLQMICMKALSKHQDNRYPDCAAMASDLRTWLAGGVPSVRTLSRKERLVRWVKTEPRLAAAVGVIGLLVVVLAIVGASFGAAQRKKNNELTLANAATERAREAAVENESKATDNARRATDNERKALDNESKAKTAEKTALDAKKIADENAAKALAAKKQATSELAPATFDRAVVVGEQGELGQCLTDLAKALVLAERAEDADLTAVIRQNLAGWRRQTHRLAEIRPLPTPPAWLAFDPSEKQSVLYGSGTPEGSKHAMRYDLTREMLIPHTRVNLSDSEGADTKPEEAATRTASTSPDGSTLLTISVTGVARVFDASSGERCGAKITPTAGAKFLSGAIFPDGKRIVLGDSRGFVTTFRRDSGDWIPGPKVQMPSLLLAPEVRALAVHPLGTRVISGGGAQLSGQIVLWDADKLTQLKVIQTALPVTAVAFSPREGNVFVSGHGTLLTGEARAWSTATGAALPGSVMKHQAEVNAVTFSKDGRFVATASQDRSARVFDCETWAAVGQPLWHGRDVRAVVFTPNGKQLVTGGDENAIRVWDLAPGPSTLPPLRVTDDAVLATATTPRADRLFIGGVLKSKEWDTGTLKLASPEELSPETVLAAAYSPDGSQLALGCVKKIARTGFVLIRDGDRIIGPFEHPRAVLSVAFSPDGRYLATGCADGIARVWDLRRTLTPVAELPHTKDGRVYVVRYSPDGNYLFTGGTDGRGLLWFTKGLMKTPSHTMQHPDGVLSVAFSDDGKRMVTGYIGAVLVWNWPDAARPPVQDGPLLPHGPAGVFAVDLSKDGNTALTGGTDGTARLWDLKTRKPLGPMWRPGTTVKSVAFLPENQFLVSGTDLHAGTVLILDKPPAVTQSTAEVTLWVEVCTGIGRKLAVLDPEEWQGSRRRFALGVEPAIEGNIRAERGATRVEWVAIAPPKPPEIAPKVEPKIEVKKEPKVEPNKEPDPIPVVVRAAPALTADSLRLLPADTDLVAVVNVKQILESDVFKKYAREQIKSLLQGDDSHKLLVDLGIDPLKDIRWHTRINVVTHESH